MDREVKHLKAGEGVQSRRKNFGQDDDGDEDGVSLLETLCFA